MKTLIASLFLIITTIQAMADVPSFDPVTSKIQKEFRAGTLPKVADLTARYRWTCAMFSAVPKDSDTQFDYVQSTFNAFNGVIQEAYTFPRTITLYQSWAETSDQKYLQHAYTASNNQNQEFQVYNSMRVYKGNLIIERSGDATGLTELFGIPLALWAHADSDPNRALILYVVCPLR